MIYYIFINFSYIGGDIILDYRLNTFITLCKVLNYTKTAEILHITQPAVTQHIKSLETSYGVKLFNYSNKTLSLTKAGSILYEFAIAVKTSSNKIKNILSMSEKEDIYLKFGATLTVGEYTMNDLLKRLLYDYPLMHVNMTVANTENLLLKLQDGEIDFAVLEGHFDKSKYGSIKFKDEQFICICSPLHHFSNKTIEFNQILDENIILREHGSGTRNIFEQILYEQNFTLDSLKHFIEIGNMKVIKDLVRENFGISFLYRESVKEELKKGTLKEIIISKFDIKREFNFVFLKESLHKKEYNKWFNYFISNLD